MFVPEDIKTVRDAAINHQTVYAFLKIISGKLVFPPFTDGIHPGEKELV